MPTNSVTSSIVQTLGAGSGIDMTALAESLATAQFAARIDRNTARAELVERQISEAASLKSMILQLASGVGDRVRTGDLSAQPSISNGSVSSNPFEIKQLIHNTSALQADRCVERSTRPGRAAMNVDTM